LGAETGRSSEATINRRKEGGEEGCQQEATEEGAEEFGGGRNIRRSVGQTRLTWIRDRREERALDCGGPTEDSYSSFPLP